MVSVSSRLQRILQGWSANLVQLLLGITQQVALIPIFLHFWSSDTLAAWLALYAAGNLAYIADAGLQLRAINRFLAFKACADADGRSARYYAAMLRIYFMLTALLIVAALAFAFIFRPSRLFGFASIEHFDLAFAVMTAGVLLGLPSFLTAALYRARGVYGAPTWLQVSGMFAGQLAQIAAVVTTGSVLAVAIAYVVPQALALGYLVLVDAYRRFPFLRGVRIKPPSWRWIAGQFRRAFPFAVAGGTEIALLNLPVLLVSVFVSDRVAVAQWGLTRVVAGLLRALCVQSTLPLTAELGHDHAIGAREALQRLYSRASALVTVLAAAVVSGLLAFWPDFFALWTHGAIPYDPVLTMTLLIGAGAAAPSILALGFANYSNRGDLLVRSKGLQLVVFLVLALALTGSMGPLGAAIAIVASDLLVQFGLLTVVIIRQTLARPVRHIVFLAAVFVAVVLAGWALGSVIRSLVPGSGLLRFVVECGLWLAVAALAASPLLSRNMRIRLSEVVPR
jgi:O-antigen/teichoic acid export membrane protein